jgi:hypothetical protein
VISSPGVVIQFGSSIAWGAMAVESIIIILEVLTLSRDDGMDCRFTIEGIWVLVRRFNLLSAEMNNGSSVGSVDL